MIGFAASLLAAWCQILLLAALALTPVQIATDPLGHVPICRADDGTQPAQPKPRNPAHSCAVCVLCISQALPLAILPPLPMLPERQSVATIQLNAAYLLGPPVRPVTATQPRGPPSLT